MSWHHLTAFIQQQVEDCTFRELCLEHVTKQSDTELKQCATMRYHALPCASMRFHALPCATTPSKSCENMHKPSQTMYCKVHHGHGRPEHARTSKSQSRQGMTRIREPILQRVLVDELDLVTEPLLRCPLLASLHHGLSEVHSDHGVHSCEANQGAHASTIVAVQLNSLHPWPHMSPLS